MITRELVVNITRKKANKPFLKLHVLANHHNTPWFDPGQFLNNFPAEEHLTELYCAAHDYFNKNGPVGPFTQELKKYNMALTITA